ncbi:DnaB-like helicase N-terminal domain-containing protein [Corynebacterium dentalis]|uniref:DnaB-like helicase N-terminal domain-containing protein n=1 Tax=Corynebacterium dentalis TaxID=2014528 RepID=UPI000C07994C|nr:DnaB-like helicase N-terminal domain-containing protein [Corynebacterium dentalis]
MTAEPAHVLHSSDQVDESQEHAARYEARLDPEALLLCGLMWVDAAPTGDVATVLNYLDATDFRKPAHGEIFKLMRAQMSEGGLITPASLAGRMAANAMNLPSDVYMPLLVAIAGLGALPSQVVHYADQVLAESYRRNFASMATYLTQVAREAPEGDLFSLMVEQGTAQRAAWKRRCGLLTAVHQPAHNEEGDTNE